MMLVIAPCRNPPLVGIVSCHLVVSPPALPRICLLFSDGEAISIHHRGGCQTLSRPREIKAVSFIPDKSGPWRWSTPLDCRLSSEITY